MWFLCQAVRYTITTLYWTIISLLQQTMFMYFSWNWAYILETCTFINRHCDTQLFPAHWIRRWFMANQGKAGQTPQTPEKYWFNDRYEFYGFLWFRCMPKRNKLLKSSAPITQFCAFSKTYTPVFTRLYKPSLYDLCKISESPRTHHHPPQKICFF